jgi:hypothetical protein
LSVILPVNLVDDLADDLDVIPPVNLVVNLVDNLVDDLADDLAVIPPVRLTGWLLF